MVLPFQWFYNTGGYDKKVLEKIEGLVDIYLPDMKYAREESAYKYSEAQDYPRINREAVKRCSVRWEK